MNTHTANCTSNTNIKVIVGMSGGVDSSVAALLLKREGYHVEGLFMQNWDPTAEPNSTPSTQKGCNATQDLIDAEAVAMKLSIRLHTVNFTQEYWDHVFEYFLDEYKAGRTPNPDILCNSEIKFKAFLEHALELGADYIATGHFVQTRKQNNHFELLKGIDANKDQSYFLHRLNQYQLSKAIFPVGELTKTDIRTIAKENGFITAEKKDSTGICFIGERKFKEFLSQYILAQPGDIETIEGKVIGKHDGLMFYTLGQRQGLGIGGLKHATEEPWYVINKDLSRNVLIVAQGAEHPALYTSTLTADQLHWISEKPPTIPFNCTAKTRYRQPGQPCTITTIQNDTAHVSFETPQRAVTPGQSVVFYNNEVCLGGGIIIM